MNDITKKNKQLLLLCGGGHPEHEISLISAKYIKETLQNLFGIDQILVEIHKDGVWRTQNGAACTLNQNKTLIVEDKETGTRSSLIDLAIPCIHGPPGETGDIQSYFEMINLPYLGCSAESSRICFNKVTSKLWLAALNIPVTPYEFVSSINEIDKAKDAFSRWGGVFVKASSQGSSVGCFKVNKIEELKDQILNAFDYSPYVLIEKPISGRELEVSVYEYKDHLHVSDPGEILTPPGKFYTYEEKYTESGSTQTKAFADNLDENIKNKIKEYSRIAFTGLKLRHLSRIDYFLTNDNEIYINEINTFPGMTPISMFPKMMEQNGVSFSDFIKDVIDRI